MKGHSVQISKKLMKYQQFICNESILDDIFKLNQIDVLKIIKYLMKIKCMFSNSLFIIRIKNLINNIILRKLYLVVYSANATRIDVIIWLPTLCKIFSVPCITIKGKSKLFFFSQFKNQIFVGVNKTCDINLSLIKRIKNLIELNDKTRFVQQEIIYY
mmetsp:Transcript_18923/g.26635  ORF Transcript_18923/g.26635 Transcript_18923/m.26635 type:complete len:158 (+) Transcript_18923:84-557(+)